MDVVADAIQDALAAAFQDDVFEGESLPPDPCEQCGRKVDLRGDTAARLRPARFKRSHQGLLSHGLQIVLRNN